MGNPDKLYQKSRDELIPYEDAEFAQLISNVPNFYISNTDQTVWGGLLRDVGYELGRLEYAHAYDIVGKNPSYLTPSDAKRQWNGPLFINRNYPQPTQFDLDYKGLVVGLIKAFQMGATTASIQGVIKAYTGQAITVEELFKQIGTFYDVSDRNMIRVSVKVGGSGSNATGTLINLDTSADEASVSLTKLKTITDDLYGAIDLAKPAHVGLNLTTVFGMDEHIGDFIHGRHGITDTLRIIALLVEEEPLPDPLYQAPFYDPTHPDTGLASIYTDGRSSTLTADIGPSDTSIPLASSAAFSFALEDQEFITAQLVGTGKWEIVKVTGVSGNILSVVRGWDGTAAASWNTGHTITPQRKEPHPGLVSPILNRVWEISEEKLDIMDMD